uniref:BCL2-associated athanogene 6 n=1 Tax=Angiostrongylus cantonensis TaxID=6313 RepID=A0A0K0DH00_ANGCA
MKIRVKVMDQTDHHFEVDDQMLLSDFRIEVADRLHIPPERQRMIFAGHVLKAENSTLSACGLRDGHVVHVVERPANMPFPPHGSESSSVIDHIQHNHHRHGRFFQNMFNSPMNGRERITYVIPFERSGLLAENAHIEEMIQSALDGLTFLTNDQRRRIATHWESNNIIHISLPPQRTPHVASPSLERVALIETLLEHISHFYQIVEMPGGIADRIDEFLDGSHTYDEENTTVFNEQLLADALSLEREPLIRSRLVDQINTEEDIDESDEHAARFQRVEETSGSLGYVMRHAITFDLVYILRRLHNEYERIRPHMVRFERILNSRILYNIDDAEHTDTDYRANFFTVYMEHIQRALHRLSHMWHLTSDLGVYLHNPMPRRLLPNYQNFQLLPPTEGEIVLEFRLPQENSIGRATTNEPASRFLDLPPPGMHIFHWIILSSD